VFPSFWQNLEGMIGAGELISPDEVLRELAKKEGDTLHRWACQQDGLFHPLDEPVQRATAEILLAFPRLVDSRKDRSMADPFVIALAKVHNCAVITGEKHSGTPEKPKMPDVCGHYSIRCISLLELFREKKWRA
jgi:hypothetical protein